MIIRPFSSSLRLGSGWNSEISFSSLQKALIDTKKQRDAEDVYQKN